MDELHVRLSRKRPTFTCICMYVHTHTHVYICMTRAWMKYMSVFHGSVLHINICVCTYIRTYMYIYIYDQCMDEIHVRLSWKRPTYKYMCMHIHTHIHVHIHI